MAGNKDREKVAKRKLVAEKEHLLPRVRASERMAKETVEESLETEAVEIPAQKEKKTKRVKQRLVVGGGVQEEMDVD